MKICKNIEDLKDELEKKHKKIYIDETFYNKNKVDINDLLDEYGNPYIDKYSDIDRSEENGEPPIFHDPPNNPNSTKRSKKIAYVFSKLS